MGKIGTGKWTWCLHKFSKIISSILIKSLIGYLLAKEGYDVWLANCRGTRYSNRHKQYTQEESKFWNFTLHEIALYDISAMINFILKKTGKSKICYIGYCQGTTLSYILCSEKPEYNESIALNISLAPIAYAKYIQCPVLKIIGYLKENVSIY